jgi:AraC-like DNA-binding protein
MNANDLVTTSGGTPLTAPGRHLAKRALRQEHRLQAPHDGRIVAVESIIWGEFHCALRLTGLARRVRLSVSRMSHLFAMETSVSPGTYLKLVRLSQAKDLLNDPKLSVKEVAALVGMAPSRLARDFRQSYGWTPRQYRLRVHDSADRQATTATSGGTPSDTPVFRGNNENQRLSAASDTNGQAEHEPAAAEYSSQAVVLSTVSMAELPCE